MSNDNYITPSEIYDQLNDEFHFNDDACPLDPNGIDGLLREWGSLTFMNPPYSRIEEWCMKAVQEMNNGKTVVALLKCDPSTKTFWRWILGERFEKYYRETGDWNWDLTLARIRFIKGRVGYLSADGKQMSRTPFPSIIAIWQGG